MYPRLEIDQLSSPQLKSSQTMFAIGTLHAAAACSKGRTAHGSRQAWRDCYVSHITAGEHPAR